MARHIPLRLFLKVRLHRASPSERARYHDARWHGARLSFGSVLAWHTMKLLLVLAALGLACLILPALDALLDSLARGS